MILSNLNLCEEPGFLYVLLIIKYLITILKILVPIILMYRAIVPFVKCIISGKELTKELNGVFKSTIAALLIFFIPTIVNYAMDTLVDSDVDSSFASCVSNTNLSTIEELKAKQEEEIEQTLKEREENINDFTKDQNEKYQEELKENLEKEEQENGANSSNDDSSTSSENNNYTTSAYGSLFVGDSRTAGLSSQVTIGSTDSIYATSGGAMQAFYSDVNKAITKINNDPSHRYNLVLNYGVNDLSQDWVNAYKTVINNLNGKANVLVVSVNPCNDSIAKYCRNSNILTLNNKLKSAFSSGYSHVKYCDTYSTFINTNNYTSMIETQEGIHYTTQGANLIYNKIRQCLSEF